MKSAISSIEKKAIISSHRYIHKRKQIIMKFYFYHFLFLGKYPMVFLF